MSSSSLPLAEVSVVQIDTLFAVWAEAVKSAWFTAVAGGMGPIAVSVIVSPVPLSLCDGVVVKPGDEKILVRVSELAGLTPIAGDLVEEVDTSISRDVIVVQLDISRQLYTLIGRRA